MNKKLGIGIVGCGNISSYYIKMLPFFKGVEVKACSDIDIHAANNCASEFGIRAEKISELLKADDIDIIVNLTVPKAHYSVSKQILEAGKHVYSEKPFVLSLQEGKDLIEIAKSKKCRIGSSPDTFLGGAHQLARSLVDSNVIGKVSSGTCFIQSSGMEMWHPNPEFFYQPGGGPVLDLGPYYITNLVQLLGPVKRVGSISSSAHKYRTITSEERYGEKIKVETPTTIHSIIEFISGAQFTFVSSWDVWHHSHSHMELYGIDGTIYIPDPNFFGGEVRITNKSSHANISKDWEHPFSTINAEDDQADYRSLGLAEMANSIIQNKNHRCSAELALHVVDIMTSILQSGDEGVFINLETTCFRPEPLGVDEAETLLA